VKYITARSKSFLHREKISVNQRPRLDTGKFKKCSGYQPEVFSSLVNWLFCNKFFLSFLTNGSFISEPLKNAAFVIVSEARQSQQREA
jgi:hypothetical protein